MPLQVTAESAAIPVGHKMPHVPDGAVAPIGIEWLGEIQHARMSGNHLADPSRAGTMRAGDQDRAVCRNNHGESAS
jgi:hypothetical protein